MEEQISTKHRSLLEKQNQVLIKINHMLGKAKQKLKLIPQKPEHKFNQRIDDLKKLPTFVNLEKELKELNILSNPVVQSQIKILRERNQQIAERQQKMEKERIQIQEIGKQLQIELDHLLQEEDIYPDLSSNFTCLLSEYKINLLSSKSTTAQIIQIIESQLANSKLLFKVQQKLKNKNNPVISIFIKKIQSSQLYNQKIVDQCDNLMAMKQELDEENYEGDQFYKSIEDSIRESEQLPKDLHRLHSPKNHEDEFDAKYKIIQQYLEKRGLDITRNEKIPNQRFLKDFKKRSSLMIRKAQNDSKKKYQESLENLSIKRRIPSNKLINISPTLSETSIKQDMISSSKNLTLSISRDLSLPKLNSDSPRKTPNKKSAFNQFSSFRNPNPDTEIKELITKAAAVEAFFLSENQNNDQTLKAMHKEITYSSRKYKEKKIRVRVENQDIIDFLKQVDEMKRFRSRRRKQ